MTEASTSVRTLADGKYALSRVLGEGAMGVVYAGVHTALGRPVAVKLLHPGLLRHEIHGQRFQREARTASKLRHRNAVQILDFGQDGDDYFIVMEFIQGRPLDDVLGDEIRIGIDRALALTSQVCAALQAAHDQGIVHRDIKPGNVIISPAVDDDGRPTETVKVVDFGLAKIQSSRLEDGHEQLTMEGDVCGTPEYMAPEQAQGLVLDHRADIYSTGVMLFDMITGNVPFTADSAIGTMYQHVHEAPPVPSSKNSRIPPALDSILLRVLAKDPADRYQTAREFRGALLSLPQADIARDQVSDIELERVTSPTMGYPEPPFSVTERPGVRTKNQAPTSPPVVEIERKPRFPWGVAALTVLVLGVGGLAIALGSGASDAESAPRQTRVAITAVVLPQGGPAALTKALAVAPATDRPTVAATTPESESDPVVVVAESAVALVAEPAPVDVVDADPSPETPAKTQVVAALEPTNVKPSIPVASPPRPRRRPRVPKVVAVPTPEPAVVAVVAPKSTPAPVEPKAEPIAIVDPVFVEPKPEPAVPKPKPALAASARFGKLAVNGALTKSSVDRVVSKTREDLQECYRKAAVAAGHDAAAKVTVRWVIDVDGRARDVRVAGRTGLPGLAPCIDRIFSRFRSRNRPDTGTVDASVVVTFTPRSP